MAVYTLETDSTSDGFDSKVIKVETLEEAIEKIGVDKKDDTLLFLYKGELLIAMLTDEDWCTDTKVLETLWPEED